MQPIDNTKAQQKYHFNRAVEGKLRFCRCYDLGLEFSHALSKLQVIARNSDWFIALFTHVVIGRSNYLSISFFDSHLKIALFLAYKLSFVASFLFGFKIEYTIYPNLRQFE